MNKPFHHQIEQALENQNLQAALDANFARRLKARLASYASLPEDIHVLRRRAHALRAGTIANLDGYLEQFTAQARKNGLIVHTAADAGEASQIVVEIARERGARLAAKAKTMVGEEIEINAALEAAGVRAVETDLGEYIVQLRGERPAHIITPAVHLRRGDVGRLFADRLGLPYTEDVGELTSAARRALRRVFLEAGIGITGANFGVAETGGLCLVTNEGNGRMVSTLPPVHVALMGIERLVPDMDGLALLLSLLARSTSGMKLTAYTNLIHAPGEGGSLRRHVVLVDNGRRRLRNTSLAEALLCIRCGACLNVCPVFREIGGHAYVGTQGQPTPYSGPIGSVISPGLFGVESFGQLARASTLCGACREACPVDINLPALLLRVRSGEPERAVDPSTTLRMHPSTMPTKHPERSRRTHPERADDGAGRRMPAAEDQPAAKAQPAPKERPASPPSLPQALGWGLRLYSWAAQAPARFSLFQRLAGWLPGRRPGWLKLPEATGWGRGRDFPRPAARSFRRRWTELEREAAPPVAVDGTGARGDSGLAGDETPAAAAADLSEQFAASLAAAGGVLHPCTPAGLPGALIEFLRPRGIRSLLAWEDGLLPAGLPEALRRAGITISSRYAGAEELAGAPVHAAGLTGAAAGVAETGSLVIPAGEGRLPAASLMARVHLAVLHARDLLPSVQDALSLPVIRQAPAVSLVTGPSRTSDIEMTQTTGMHGPGEVHVFLIEG